MGKIVRLLFPVLLILAAYYAVFGGEYSVPELRRMRAELREAQVELERLQGQNDSLRVLTDSLETDLSAIERMARGYGLVGDDEELVQPVLDAPADSTGGASSR